MSGYMVLINGLCGGAIAIAIYGTIKCLTAKKQQATKDSRAQVELHIERQKALGERMIGDRDDVRAWELIATVAVIGFILFGTFRGWW
jgi:TRAP-type C4-dicarboxylate transport system permease large subunit